MDSPVVSAAEMRAAEEAAFARGIEVEALMDEAGAGVARAVQQFFPRAGHCIVYAGKGHNGGDALVAAECLQRDGMEDRCPSSLSRKRSQRIDPQETCRSARGRKCRGGRAGRSAEARDTRASTPGPTIILDGLLGVGTKKLLREPLRATARELNRVRLEQNAFVFAVDLPTGFDSDTGEIDPDSVVADFTVTIGFAKHGLLADGAIDFVGRIVVLPLPDLEAGGARNEIMATPQALARLIPRRKFSAHKNQMGRIGVVAGSKGFVGAALMTAAGALRSGAGLVELFVPEDIYEIAASAAPPEVMVKATRAYKDLPTEKIDVWAVGPGLGTRAWRRGCAISSRESSKPMVIDADGLNLLAEEIEVLNRCRGPRLLTPHPGEMERLVAPGK